MTPGYLIPSPLGDIVLRVEDDWLTGVFFVGQRYFPPISPTRIHSATPPLVRHARQQIAEFLAGERRTFTVPLRLRGTPFQQRVWKELIGIPYGTLTSYREIAQRLDLAAGHARAVGRAVGRNPVSLIVPCHRVVSSAGGLTGYAGGLHRKAALLALEQRGDALAAAGVSR